MPELGDVAGFRRCVTRLRGATITGVDVFDVAVVRNASPEALRAAVTGSRIGEAARRGKWLLVAAGPWVLVFHFGMTGSLHLAPDRVPLDVHDRIVFSTARGQLRFTDARRLGGVHLAADDGGVADVIGKIGPDALAVSASVLRQHLETGRGSIKAGLLDQARIAGIGNFGSDEILWRARIRPDTPTRTLDEEDWATLHRSMRQVLQATVRAGHTPRGPTWLTRARFGPDPLCPRCGARLDHDRIAARTSIWCPVCQPEPRQ